jgi:FkbM family methyltransferase
MTFNWTKETKIDKLLCPDGNKIKIPNRFTQIKIDVGTAFNAPNSEIWLSELEGRIVFGFEPNPDSVHELLTGKNRQHGNGYRYLNLDYIDKSFYLIQCAIDDCEPCYKRFYMTSDNAGQSSLHEPTKFRLQKVIDVPCIRLSDFLDLIPWEKISYIEHLKIDAQGNDLRILQSVGDYLTERIVFVTAELDTYGQYKYSHNGKELKKFMKKRGFRYVKRKLRGPDNATFINKRFKKMAKIEKLDYRTEGI